MSSKTSESVAQALTQRVREPRAVKPLTRKSVGNSPLAHRLSPIHVFDSSRILDYNSALHKEPVRRMDERIYD